MPRNQATRYDRDAADAAAAQPLVEIDVRFLGDGTATRYFCDLTVDYVRSTPSTRPERLTSLPTTTTRRF